MLWIKGSLGFLGGTVVCQCWRCRRRGLGNGNLVQYFWKIPWTEEPSGLQSMGLQRVRHDSAPPPKVPSDSTMWRRECIIVCCIQILLCVTIYSNIFILHITNIHISNRMICISLQNKCLMFESPKRIISVLNFFLSIGQNLLLYVIVTTVAQW